MSIWKLSATAERDAEALRSCVQQATFWGRTAKICNLLEALSDHREPAAIPFVASGLFSSSKAIHATASSGVGRLLPLVPSAELIRLVELLRAGCWGCVSVPWDRVKPKHVQACLASTGDTALASLLSLHKNGYVRQVAVRFLTNVESGKEVRFLLLRQNDWVDSISQDAKSAVMARLTESNLAPFVCESDLILQLLHCRRRDLGRIVSRYISLLIAPKQREQLKEAVHSGGKRAQRKLIELLISRDGKHVADVVRFGLCSDDGIARSKCLRRASDCLSSDECAELAESRLCDKFVSVRLEANRLKAASLPADSAAVWKQALFDRSRTLRETAIFFLKKDGYDTAAIYREALSRSPNNLPALSGLVESGDQTDVALFTRNLSSPYASRRAEAVRGIGRVGGESDIVCIQRSLLDESARVVRVAYQQLSGRGAGIDAEELFSMIDDCRHLAGKKAVVRLLDGLGRWRAMSFLISAAANEDAPLADYSKSLIEASFCRNRVFTQPSSEQKRQIQNAIDESLGALGQPFLRDLHSFLSSYGFSV